MRCRCPHCIRPNPDFRLRELERHYSLEPSLETGVNLLNVYLRLQDIDAAQPLLDEMEDLYPGPYTDLAVESVLIRANFMVGNTSADLFSKNNSIICKYSKPLIWDIMRGYEEGTSQSWINDINSYLFQTKMVTRKPRWYDDSNTRNFHRLKTPFYAVSLFHDLSTGKYNTSFLRVVWNNIEVTGMATPVHLGGWHSPNLYELMLEDEPMFRPYEGPRLCFGGIPIMATTANRAMASGPTKRVNLSIGVERAVDVCIYLAKGIYSSQSIEESHEYLGVGTYYPDDTQL
jgi:hypothetical protein